MSIAPALGAVTVITVYVLADWWWRREMAKRDRDIADQYGSGDVFNDNEEKDL